MNLNLTFNVKMLINLIFWGALVQVALVVPGAIVRNHWTKKKLIKNKFLDGIFVTSIFLLINTWRKDKSTKK